MPSLLDAFGLHRRQAPRVAVVWQVRIGPAQPGTLYQTRDVSRLGLRLQGGDAGELRALLSDEGRAALALHLPGRPDPLAMEAELRWGLHLEGGFVSGWRFTRIAHAAQQALDEYIAAHPEEIMREPRWG